jgi:integrative and conjugative element protein (TIGR02256 family)
MNYDINNLKIIVNDKILDNIRRYYCSNINYETGGILLGKFNKENRVIEITEVYELKTNLFSRILYKRSARKAQKIINRRWHETNGAINYIGEWHTHPNMQAVPSSTDINSLKEITEKVKGVLPGTILIISGKDDQTNLILQKDNVIRIQPLLKEREEGE